MTNRFAFLVPVAGALLGIASAANAVIVPGVYNTGLGIGGTTLAAGDGQVDANYRVTATDGTATIGANALTYYNPAYLQDGPLSRIVNSNGNGNETGSTFTTFSTTFSLAGYNATNATISGQVLFDNYGEIFLNGNQIGPSISGFGSLTPFGTNANFFVAGLNTLSFVLHNTGGPEAFQVAGLTVTRRSGRSRCSRARRLGADARRLRDDRFGDAPPQRCPHRRRLIRQVRTRRGVAAVRRPFSFGCRRSLSCGRRAAPARRRTPRAGRRA